MSSKPDISSGRTDKKGWIKKLLEWISDGAEKERKNGDICRS